MLLTTGVASNRAQVPAGVTLAPGQHYLFTNTSTSGGPYSGSVPGDTTYGTGFSDGAGARITLADATTVIDGVGGAGIAGTQCREGTGISTMTGANIDQSYERVGGTLDTDNNATDFVGPKAGNPQKYGPTGGDAAPSVTDTDPDGGAVDVAQSANVTVTFSEAVTTSAAAFSISCSASGAHTFAFSSTTTSAALDPDVGFAQAETCTVTVDDAGVADVDPDDPPNTMTADHTFSFSTVAPSRRICARERRVRRAGERPRSAGRPTRRALTSNHRNDDAGLLREVRRRPAKLRWAKFNRGYLPT